MGKYRIHFYITELNSPLDCDRTKSILDILLAYPFGNYEEMTLNLWADNVDNIKYEKFDENKLRSHLIENYPFGIVLVAGCRPENFFQPNLRIIFSSNSEYNRLTLLVDHDDFIEKEGTQKLLNFVYKIGKKLNNANNGTVTPNAYNPEFQKKLGVDCPYPCLEGSVYWINIMGRKEYEEFFTKEVVLSVPAFKVEQWDNEVIFIQNYEDPFSIDLPETQEKILKICNYWNENAVYEEW